MPDEEVLSQLIKLEPIFHRFEHLQGRAPNRSDFASLAAPEFFEIGASGRLYTRDFILDTLEERFRNPSPAPDLWSTSDFRLLRLGSNTWLLNYLLEQELPSSLRTTRRSTIWRKSLDDWQILFHQGTLL
ncbi:MAG TPA: DUF4440 domain-containing protein [Edaphobacter sp.]